MLCFTSLNQTGAAASLASREVALGNGNHRLAEKGLAHPPTAANRAALLEAWRGSQVVRPRSAKPLCAGSIPARASKLISR